MSWEVYGRDNYIEGFSRVSLGEKGLREASGQETNFKHFLGIFSLCHVINYFFF